MRIPINAKKVQVGDILTWPFRDCEVTDVDLSDVDRDHSVGVLLEDKATVWLSQWGSITVERPEPEPEPEPELPFGTIIENGSYGLVVKTREYGWVSVGEDHKWSHWDDERVRDNAFLKIVFQPTEKEEQE